MVTKGEDMKPNYINMAPISNNDIHTYTQRQ